MFRPLRLAAAILLLGGFASPALAHALLRRADPGVGATLHAAPAAVTLTFSEGVEPAFSRIEVTSAAGAREDAGSPAIVGGDQKVLRVALKPLAAGTYTVVWHATSVDTHKTEGKFTFSVGP
jgi:copper resistance protein C